MEGYIQQTVQASSISYILIHLRTNIYRAVHFLFLLPFDDNDDDDNGDKGRGYNFASSTNISSGALSTSVSGPGISHKVILVN